MCAAGNNFVENTCQVNLGDAFILKLTSDYPQSSGYVLVEPVKVWFSTRTQSLSWLQKGAAFKKYCSVLKKNWVFFTQQNEVNYFEYVLDQFTSVSSLWCLMN